MARAKPTRRRMPPESWDGSFSPAPSSRTSARHSSTRSRISPFDIFVSRCKGKATFCQTVMESKSAPSWNAMPNLRRNSVISRLPSISTATPSTSTVPASGLSRPMTCFRSTLLPRARAADDDQRLGARHVEVDAVEHHLGAEGLAQAADADLDGGALTPGSSPIRPPGPPGVGSGGGRWRRLRHRILLPPGSLSPGTGERARERGDRINLGILIRTTTASGRSPRSGWRSRR